MRFLRRNPPNKKTSASYLVDYGKKRRATLHFCQRKCSCVGPVPNISIYLLKVWGVS